MPTLPLVSHPTPESIIAWRSQGAVKVCDFLTEVYALAARFPAGGNLLNLCNDRYRFSVGVAAAIVSGRVSLLPSTHTPGVLRQVTDFAPDVFCLTDGDLPAVGLPTLRYPDASDANHQAPDTLGVPQIDDRQLVAIVFTSGSTGIPQPHRKTWGALVSSVRAEASHLGIPSDVPCTIIGTVPPQHMYGFESTVLMPWQTGVALSNAQPFYPADIANALAAVPASRVLVSSPLHLRALMEAEIPIPELMRVVSATAPLSEQLARDMEARWHAPLMEIYGSTETGQIASRRPTQTAQWHLFPGVTFSHQGERVLADGGHVETAVLMNDVIEPIDDTHFLLHGRLADLVNIAGKRHSLGNLNHLLSSIPGVVDGAFYMPEVDESQGVTRLAACVVAPGLNAAQLMAALREHLDPVFLPRPLLFVDALPRNNTGKLPREALRSLFEQHGAWVSA